jgi:hypothetical protein
MGDDEYSSTGTKIAIFSGVKGVNVVKGVKGKCLFRRQLTWGVI